jgi:transposase
LPDGSRGEVISVVQRRRRWTTEQKLALVEEAMRADSSVAGVADRRGVSRSLLFEWRRQVREGAMPGVVRAQTAPALVPIRIVENAPAKEAPRPPMPSRKSAERAGKSSAMVELVLSNGRVLRVSEAIAPEVLARLAAALDG